MQCFYLIAPNYAHEYSNYSKHMQCSVALTHTGAITLIRMNILRQKNNTCTVVERSVRARIAKDAIRFGKVESRVDPKTDLNIFPINALVFAFPWGIIKRILELAAQGMVHNSTLFFQHLERCPWRQAIPFSKHSSHDNSSPDYCVARRLLQPNSCNWHKTKSSHPSDE